MTRRHIDFVRQPKQQAFQGWPVFFWGPALMREVVRMLMFVFFLYRPKSRSGRAVSLGAPLALTPLTIPSGALHPPDPVFKSAADSPLTLILFPFSRSVRRLVADAARPARTDGRITWCA